MITILDGLIYFIITIFHSRWKLNAFRFLSCVYAYRDYVKKEIDVGYLVKCIQGYLDLEAGDYEISKIDKSQELSVKAMNFLN